ncbi:hypothetical protein [Methylomonas fluvii]|uniref:Uncharacterized protein n=1 Tax=Methylomonas fluvii TaxID=1854564 RepID=A0ABR9DHI1_9GAMM|nr:hypothetical protein [Methylomonas fluvii]MBD9362568.1 hypothetical protein [Methylomonas fluvii]
MAQGATADVIAALGTGGFGGKRGHRRQRGCQYQTGHGLLHAAAGFVDGVLGFSLGHGVTPLVCLGFNSLANRNGKKGTAKVNFFRLFAIIFLCC